MRPLIYDFTHLWDRLPSCKLCMWIGTPCWHRQFERPMYFFAFHKIPKTLNSSWGRLIDHLQLYLLLSINCSADRVEPVTRNWWWWTISMPLRIQVHLYKIRNKLLLHQQCGNFRIFLSLRFYVKSILWMISRSSKTAILTILKALNFDFYAFLQF